MSSKSTPRKRSHSPTSDAPALGPVDTTAGNAAGLEGLDGCLDLDTPFLDATMDLFAGGDSAAGQLAAQKPADPTPEPNASPKPTEGPTPEELVLAGELEDAVGYGAFNLADTETAEQLLKGRTPAQMRRLRLAYKHKFGRNLESDIRSVHEGEKGHTTLMKHTLSGMSLEDKIHHYDTSAGLKNLIDGATPEELEALKKEPAILDRLKQVRDQGVLGASDSDKDLYTEMAVKLMPASERKTLVAQRIRDAKGWLDDDEDGAMKALSLLPQEDRIAVMKEHAAAYSYMNKHEIDRMNTVASGSPARALQARMMEATYGMGTEDQGVSAVIADTKALMDERGQLLKGPRPFTPKTSRRLRELDEVKAMLSRDANGKLSTFLEQLDGDVMDAEFQVRMKELGMSEEQIAEKKVHDALWGPTEDEDAVREAFASLPPAKRKALYAKKHVKEKLDGLLSAEERKELAVFVDDDRLEMARVRLEEGNGIVSDNEGKMFKAVFDLSQAERETLQKLPKEDPRRQALDKALDALAPGERAALSTVLKTGQLDTKTGMDVVTDGIGTNHGLFDVLTENMTVDQRLRMRKAYVDAREGHTTFGAPLVESRAERQARLKRQTDLDAWRSIESDVSWDMTGDDEQKAIGSILDHRAAKPGRDGTLGRDSKREEEKTGSGRMLGSHLIDKRSDDKMGTDLDGGGWLADAFIDENETAVQSHQLLKSTHVQNVADGEVDLAEMKTLNKANTQFTKDHQAMTAAQDSTTNTATTVLGTTVGLILTALSKGIAGPAVAKWLAAHTAHTAATTTLLTMAAKKAMGGDRYDLMGEDGAADLANGITSFGISKGLQNFGLDTLGEKGALKMGMQPMGMRAADGVTKAPLKSLMQDLPSQMIQEAVNTSVDLAVNPIANTITNPEAWKGDKDALGLYQTQLLNDVQNAPASYGTKLANHALSRGVQVHRTPRGTSDLSFDDQHQAWVEGEETSTSTTVQDLPSPTSPLATATKTETPETKPIQKVKTRPAPEPEKQPKAPTKQGPTEQDQTSVERTKTKAQEDSPGLEPPSKGASVVASQTDQEQPIDISVCPRILEGAGLDAKTIEGLSDTDLQHIARARTVYAAGGDAMDYLGQTGLNTDDLARVWLHLDAAD